VNPLPRLAPDVKRTHGAAIGQLDEDALFYVRARGLTLAGARAMLIQASAWDPPQAGRRRWPQKFLLRSIPAYSDST
jgi:hypothetical protein